MEIGPLNPFGLPDLDLQFSMTRRVAGLHRQRRVELRRTRISARDHCESYARIPFPRGNIMFFLYSNRWEHTIFRGKNSMIFC